MSKARGILFSAAMVRAIIAGSKTQTRRLIDPEHVDERGAVSVRPLVEAGDTLWVREAWRTMRTLDSLSGSAIAARALRDPLVVMVDVRVERLGVISEADAIAEGAIHWARSRGEDWPASRAFPELWEHVHGEGAWERDRKRWTWVFVWEHHETEAEAP